MYTYVKFQTIAEQIFTGGLSVFILPLLYLGVEGWLLGQWSPI